MLSHLSHARFNTALTNEQIMAKAPSVFSQVVADRVSDRYQHISTIDLVEGLRKEGFVPVRAVQSGSRINGREMVAKHMLRFRKADQETLPGGLIPELVLINSHDGLSSYKLIAGLYRLVCANGLMAATNNYREVRVKHQGDILGNVIEGTYEIIDETKKLIESANHMSSIQLNNDEKQIFAESVHQLRFDRDESPLKNAIQPAQFLRARRMDDRKDDLFTVFNVAQENLIKGGLSGYGRTENGGYKRQSTREVKSIDQSTSLNRAIWALAEKMAELKS